MAKQDNQDVFDVERIRELIELMKEHDLSEIDLKQQEQEIRLKRGGEQPMMVNYPSAPVGPAPVAAGAAGAASETPAEDPNAVFINSPMVGTFYTKPKPEADVFVKVGDIVEPDTVVCIVEAMKTFNELPAGVSGKIAAILVKDQDPVDVNKPLFKIVPA